MSGDAMAQEQRYRSHWNALIVQLLDSRTPADFLGRPEEERIQHLDRLFKLPGFVSLLVDDDPRDRRLDAASLLLEPEISTSQLATEAWQAYYRVNHFRVADEFLNDLLLRRQVDPQEWITYLSLQLSCPRDRDHPINLTTMFSTIQCCPQLQCLVLELVEQDPSQREQLMKALEGARDQIVRLDDQLSRGVWIRTTLRWNSMGQSTQTQWATYRDGHHADRKDAECAARNDDQEAEATSMRQRWEEDDDWF
jgi:hypothetical protein